MLDDKQDTIIIFDLDGTLLDTTSLIHASFEHAFKQYKPEYHLTEEEHLSFLGPPLRDSFLRYFDESIVDEVVDCYREHNHSCQREYVTMFDSVLEGLDDLKEKGYPLAIVSTKFSVPVYIGLDLFNLRDYFDMIICGEEVEHPKPDPEGILKVMQTLNYTKAVYVGDTQTDIQAGKNAGVITAGVSWAPKGVKQLRDVHPDIILERLSDLIGYLEEE